MKNTKSEDVPLTIDELLSQGAEQISRKYQMVARLPPGMTGLEALKERAPDLYRNIMERAEHWAADDYRRLVARQFDDSFTLTVPEFSEFLRKTGRSGWEIKGPPCENCGSFGHLHSKSCRKKTRGVT